MTDRALPNGSDDRSGYWYQVLKMSMAIPGVKVDRESFLRSQLKAHCDEYQVQEAVDTRPAVAGVPPAIVDKLADSCISWNRLKTSSVSFVAGMPGGWAMAGTIPADLGQFYGHAVRLAQELAYLYGWPDLFSEEGEFDEETMHRVTLLIGAMMGSGLARRGLADIAKRFADEVTHRLPRRALTQYGFFNMAKQVARWIGIRLTKKTFASAVAKIVPLVGGAISSSISFVAMTKMAGRLKNHLRELRYAYP